MDELEYILNDEGVVNSHGFVLLNAAGRFDRYNANPVMLFNHESGSIIGQMKGIRIDGTRLIGQAEFDEEDPLGLKCKRQAKKGILRGCSPGIIINAVEMRIGPDGEERLTVTDWELLETSLVGVPSN
ncbi:MAG: HK97 family phage prohead protease, partial [Lepagella sp.]